MKNKKKKLVAALLGILMIFSSTASAFAETINVTFNGSVYSYYANGSKPEGNIHGSFTTRKGNVTNIAFCAEHGIPSPMGDKIGNDCDLEMKECDDPYIRKILYYGWKGPQEWAGFHDPAYNGVYQINFAGNISKDRALSCGIAVTSMALTEAYKGSGTWYDVSGLSAFKSYINSLPAPDAGFTAYLLPSKSSLTQDLFTWEYTPIPTDGWAQVRKESLETTTLSLAGAKYGVYQYYSDAQNDTNRLDTLRTYSSGNSSYATLAPGKYYVKEVEAPKGFDLDTEIHEVTVVSNETAVVTSKEPVTKGYARLKKGIKNDEDLVSLCPENYTLEGAKYGVYKYYSEAESKKEPAYTLTTDKNGDTNTLTLLPGNYYVRELLAPKGYDIDKEIYPVTVRASETSVVNCKDEPLFDPLDFKLVKKAADGSDKNLPLEGAKYSIKYYKEYLNEEQVKNKEAFRTWYFKTDKNGRFAMFDRWKVGGDELFKNKEGRPVGLHGTYVFEEEEAPKGFAKTEGIISIQHLKHDITHDTVTVLKDVEDIEKPQTISLTINKVDAETGLNKPQGYGTLAGAKYDVFFFDPVLTEDVKVATLTTDENGFARYEGGKPGLYKVVETKASDGYIIDREYKNIKARIKEINTANFDYVVKSKEQPITVEVEKTSIDKTGVKITVSGAKLQLLDKDKNVLETFTSTDKKHVIKGLKQGKYYIREVETPEGYLPMEEDFAFEVKAEEKPQNVEIFNEPKPEIKTTATVNGNKNVKPDKEISVTDTFEYIKVMKDHKYIIKGKLLDKATGKAIASAEKLFTPNASNGKVEVKFTFDASKYTEGGEFVVTEKLYRVRKDGSERLVAEHEDISDLNQTINIPKIKTTALDKADGNKNLVSAEKQTIVDKVEYKNLYAGKEYTVKGVLMNKATGKPILVDGKEVTSKKTFKAEKTSGFVELEFTFDSSALKGETIVVFEDLYEGKIEVAAHADISDKEQTIFVPEIKTTATDKIDDGKDLNATDKQTVVDKVSYKSLYPNKAYTIKGILMDRETGKPILDNGKEVTSEKTFTPDKANGTVSLEFNLNASSLKGKTIVVFETLFEDGEKLTEHTDIADVDQSIYVPEIKTTATSQLDGGKELLPVNTVIITDKVEYKNLIKGQMYEMRGSLVNTKSKEILAKASGCFVAENTDGFVTLDFEIDATELKGKDVVVFEELVKLDEDGEKVKEVAEHADIDDKGQTVRVVNPKIKTTATFIDGTKENAASKNITIIDEVMYSDFVSGKEYTIKGILMNKKTGEPYITPDGNKVTIEKTFVTEKNTGVAEVEFNFNGLVETDIELVVFQEIYYDGQIIAVHSDINDASQTVEITKPHEPVPTGDNTKPVELLFIMLACAYIFFKKKQKSTCQEV